MSENECIRGIIELVPRQENEEDKEYFERVTGQNYKKYDYDPSSLMEAIWDNDLGEQFIEIHNSIYKFIEYKELDPYGNFCNITSLPNGQIQFHTMFYNGGTCLQEMLESKMDYVKSKNN